MSTAPRVWALLDDRPGNRNQVLGIAEALGWPFEIREIRFNRLAVAPNALIGATLRSLEATGRAALAAPWPDLVIAAGRRSVPPARWIKRQHPNTCLVQLMWPGSTRGLDLIAVPEHDHVPEDPRILRTAGAPHRLTPERLAMEGEAFRPRVAHLPQPWIAGLVGGASRHADVPPEAFRIFADKMTALAEERGGSLLITTSRRTGEAGEQALRQGLAARPHFLHKFGDGGNNPYLGLLGVAEAVVASSDSASMVSEACATGRPTFLHDLSEPPAKLARFHARLQELGHVHRLGAPWPDRVPPPLLPQLTVADAIRRMLGVARER